MRLALWTAWAVELWVQPAKMGARPAATSMVISMTRWVSASVRVEASPVVPQGMRMEDALGQLGFYEGAEGRLVERAVGVERSDERGAAALEFHTAVSVEHSGWCAFWITGEGCMVERRRSGCYSCWVSAGGGLLSVGLLGEGLPDLKERVCWTTLPGGRSQRMATITIMPRAASGDQ